MTFAASHVRFSAFLMTDTGRKTRNGGAMLDYALTASTAQVPLDAVLLDGKLVGKSPALADLARRLDGNALADGACFVRRLIEIIRAEAGRWRLDEDLSRRKHLLEGSDLALRQEADGAYTLAIQKPAKPED